MDLEISNQPSSIANPRSPFFSPKFGSGTPNPGARSSVLPISRHGDEHRKLRFDDPVLQRRRWRRTGKPAQRSVSRSQTRLWSLAIVEDVDICQGHLTISALRCHRCHVDIRTEMTIWRSKFVHKDGIPKRTWLWVPLPNFRPKRL